MVATAPTSAPLSADRKVVLVAERDAQARDLEKHFLSESGLEVKAVTDGRAALELAMRLRPSLVVTEILIPKLDGLALCKQIRSSPETRESAVLVVSILAASVRAREAGADGFLLKPLSEERLVETVKSILAAKERTEGQ